MPHNIMKFYGTICKGKIIVSETYISPRIINLVRISWLNVPKGRVKVL